MTEEVEKVEELLGVRSYKLNWRVRSEYDVVTHFSTYEDCAVEIKEYPGIVRFSVYPMGHNDRRCDGHTRSLVDAQDHIERTLREWFW